jgi:lipopolysaccharide assembly protein A
MRLFFFLVLLLLVGAVGVFAFQNQTLTPLQFFDWSASYPLALLVGIVYFLGMVSGWTVVGMVRRTFRRVTDDPVRWAVPNLKNHGSFSFPSAHATLETLTTPLGCSNPSGALFHGFSFPGSAWERTASEALPRGWAKKNAVWSLAGPKTAFIFSILWTITSPAWSRPGVHRYFQQIADVPTKKRWFLEWDNSLRGRLGFLLVLIDPFFIAGTAVG